VSSTARTQVLTRDILDAVPTGRTIQALGQLIVGVTLNAPDVGGSPAMQQTYMTTRGLTSANNIVRVDGKTTRTSCSSATTGRTTYRTDRSSSSPARIPCPGGASR